MNLGPHAGFIVAAYALAGAVVAALAVWITADYRRQTRTLRQLEERGITRRSAATPPPAGASPRGVAL